MYQGDSYTGLSMVEMNSALHAAAIDRPAQPCSAVIKVGKPLWCLVDSFGFWQEPEVETSLDLRPISAETSFNLRGVFSVPCRA